ncbi:hypothetical protein H8356DRAFT_1437109 [Neocallimastix lanati (nom. inval.)]|nr:hypothetical protein H8356DRAFT_1437109 [Neocallimastix sp. JGI-2020a]
MKEMEEEEGEEGKGKTVGSKGIRNFKHSNFTHCHMKINCSTAELTPPFSKFQKIIFEIISCKIIIKIRNVTNTSGFEKNNDNSTNNGNTISRFPAKIISIGKLRTRTITYVKINLIGQLDNEILDFKDI